MIFFYGDLHGEFSHVLGTVDQHRPSAIVLLGDVQAKLPLERELEKVLGLTDVWWIPGNHDVDSQDDYNNLFESELADRNLHGRVVEVAGVRIAGLGGVFRESIWYPKSSADVEPVCIDYTSCVNKLMEAERWKEYRRIKKLGQALEELPNTPLICKGLLHKSTIFWSDWMELHGQQADILVTHEAPSCHPNGFYGIDALGRSMGVCASFHGHQHDCLDYSLLWTQLGFKAYGIGLCGVSDQDGNMIIAGKLDEKRSYRQKMILSR